MLTTQSDRPVKKRNNFLSKLGNRLSRFFHKSSKSKNRDIISNEDTEELHQNYKLSKSHDDLTLSDKQKKVKRNRFKKFLGISSKPNRCMSEGDLIAATSGTDHQSCHNDLAITPASIQTPTSTNSRRDKQRPRTIIDSYNSSINDLLSDDRLSPSPSKQNHPGINGSHLSSQGSLRSDAASGNIHFKNELAKRLRDKSQQNEPNQNDTDTPMNPNSLGRSQTNPPINNSGGGTSGSSPTRTPHSLSSISTNSLLSGGGGGGHTMSGGVGGVCVVGLSSSGNTTSAHVIGGETESLSRSIHDSIEDSGILADFTAPISKTTNASLLDSTAAHQKISASKHRRARPRAAHNTIMESASDTSSSSETFSPPANSNHEHKDLLQGIQEEDLSTVPSINNEENAAPNATSIANKEEPSKKSPLPSKTKESPLKIDEISSKSQSNTKSDELFQVKLRKKGDSPTSQKLSEDSKFPNVQLKPLKSTEEKREPTKIQKLPEETKDIPKKEDSKFPTVQLKSTEEKKQKLQEETKDVPKKEDSKFPGVQLKSTEEKKQKLQEETKDIPKKEDSKFPGVQLKSTEEKKQKLSEETKDIPKKEDSKFPGVQLKLTEEKKQKLQEETKDILKKEDSKFPTVQLKSTEEKKEVTTSKFSVPFKSNQSKETANEKATEEKKEESKFSGIQLKTAQHQKEDSSSSLKFSVPLKSTPNNQKTPEDLIGGSKFPGVQLKSSQQPKEQAASTGTKEAAATFSNVQLRKSTNTNSDNTKKTTISEEESKFPVKLKSTGRLTTEENKGKEEEKNKTSGDNNTENVDVRTRINKFTKPAGDEPSNKITNKLMNVQIEDNKRSSRVLDMVKGIEHH